MPVASNKQCHAIIMSRTNISQARWKSPKTKKTPTVPVRMSFSNKQQKIKLYGS